MPEIKEKLAAYACNIITQAEAEADTIRAETSEAETKALAEIEAGLAAEAEHRIALGCADAKAHAERRVVACTMQNRHQLLEYREQCAADVFEEVRKRVEAYTESDAYAEKLRAFLVKAFGTIPGVSKARVYLRPKDMVFKDELAAALPSARLEFAEGHFVMGGLMLVCEEKCRRIDLTFDSEFTDLSGRFSEITGFRLEG